MGAAAARPGRVRRAGGRGGRGAPITGNPEPFPGLERKATVALIHGDDRRKNVYNALMAIDKDLQPKLKTRKYVVIKPNFVNTVNQLAASHVDAMRGILDYLSERFTGPVVIAESSAGNTQQGYENFKYTALPAEYKKQQVQLIDLNAEAKFEHDRGARQGPAHRAGAAGGAAGGSRSLRDLLGHAEDAQHRDRLAVHQEHGVGGAAALCAQGNGPLEREAQVPRRPPPDPLQHAAHRAAPGASWGASVIDGYEGMEGNGPNSGTPVASRLAIASADFVATDRIGAECMGINPEWLGYVKYCSDLLLGQFDTAKIDVIGGQVADVKKPYRIHPDIDQELQWQGPMTELPFNLGWVTPQHGPEAV